MVLNKKFTVPSLYELFKTTINRSEWDSKTPLRKWCYLYGIGRICLSVLGFPVFQEKRTYHWYSYVFCMYTGLEVILVLYTAYYYLPHGNWQSFLPCSILLIGPLFCSAPLAYVSLTEKCDMLNCMISFGGRYIHPDNNDSTEYNKICSKQIDRTIRRFAFEMAIMWLALNCTMIGPMYAYYIHGERTTMTELKIPFTEPYSNVEYFANIAITTLIGCHGFIGYVGIEIAMTFFSDVVLIVPKLVEFEFRQLHENINDLTEPQLLHIFNNIVMQSLDSDRYLNHLGEVFYYRTLVTPSFLTYAIGLAIFCQFKVEWE